MSTLTPEAEPVRLRGWAAVAASGAVTFALAILSGTAWPGAVAAAVMVAAPMVGGIEWQRKAAWSPVSVRRATLAAEQIVRLRPEDDVPDPDSLLEMHRDGTTLAPSAYRYTYPKGDSDAS